MNNDLRQKVLNIAGPLAEAEGVAVWGLEIIGGPRTTVRLFIDTPAQSQSAGDQDTDNEMTALSATIDQCERISRSLGLALEVEDSIQGPWTLEVSSPGLERKFFQLEQMRAYVGDLVECSLYEALPEQAGRRSYRGRLVETGPDYFVIEPCSISGTGEITKDDSPIVRVPWANTRFARRIHVFAPPLKPGKGPKEKAARQK